MVFTNAAGGINLAFERGGLVLISDHINLQGSNPLVGPERRFAGPALSRYVGGLLARVSRDRASRWRPNWAFRSARRRLRRDARARATRRPAEIRYLRAIGADLVGMSTVPEVIVANHMGMKVLGISCVTNMAAGILPQKINHEEVLETGAMVRDTLVRFLKALLPRLEGMMRPAD